MMKHLDEYQATDSSTPQLDESSQHEDGRQHSGIVYRPFTQIGRETVSPETARTELEQYKLAMRKHHPVDHGLPITCEATCCKCGRLVDSKYIYEESEDAVYLEYDCPQCNTHREKHDDAMFVKKMPDFHPHQPETTHTGAKIKPPLKNLPRTVETLCPECSAIILGRYFEMDGDVWMEKTCPEHGYCRDKIFTDAKLYIHSAKSTFQDERGMKKPPVRDGKHCPSDCGGCGQHLSGPVLPQIDLTNRCNLACPICFASASAAGKVSQPSYEMVVEMMQALRNIRPYPSTAIQFTGGEPTIHPDFHRIVAKATEMGFSHIQIATNGITHANYEFAKRSAEAGLHTLYMQFDGPNAEIHKKLRGEDVWEYKQQVVENCKRTGMKICLVPTIVKGVNDHLVGDIFRYAVDHVDAISAIAYQPVSFCGRINQRDREAQRYTLGDLAHTLVDECGCDIERDFLPLGVMSPLSRVMQLMDGKPKIRASCHSDCAFGTYYFVTPEKEAIPIPSLFNFYKLMKDFNDYALKIGAKRDKATKLDTYRIAWKFAKNYRWSARDKRIGPMTFIRALLGLTNKKYGRGDGERKSYKTLMAAGMHFMDRYNYDTERVKRCVIQYSTPDGFYPFCAINGGPTFRPFIEDMLAVPSEQWKMENPEIPIRPAAHPDAVQPWEGKLG